MASLEEMISKFEKLDFNKMLDEVLNDLLPQIIDNVLDQLESGYIKDNTSPDYTYGMDSEYMKTKASMGIYSMNIAPRINLKYSGDFYSGFYAIVKKEIIEIGSKDSKANKLETEFTKELFELDSNNMNWLRSEVKPQVQELLRKQLGII